MVIHERIHHYPNIKQLKPDIRQYRYQNNAWKILMKIILDEVINIK